MPEAPELQVAKEFLQRVLPGQTIIGTRIIKPTVLRPLASTDISSDIVGRHFEGVQRKGKSLILDISGGRLLAVFPMLAGALQYCGPKERLFKTACFVLSLSSGNELRYLDERQMGMAYYLSLEQTTEVRRMEDGGPDVLDEMPPSEQFAPLLRKHRGEIKGILTRGRLVAGIGNAYADEVLFRAGIFPFKKVRTLKPEEVHLLYDALRDVPQEAVAILRKRMGDQIHIKIRDFMQVHGKGGLSCPKCGGRISSITANQRITNFCRHCQPGLLVHN